MKARKGLVLILSVVSIASSLPGIAHSKSLPIPDHPQLQFFKQPNGFVWLDALRLTTHAKDALSFIQAASIHGLDPEDYHFSLLQKLAQDTVIDRAGYFDSLLTDAMLDLIHDLAIGRLSPQKVDPTWFIPRDNISPVEELQKALLSPYLKNTLNQLLPKLPQYHQLTNSLSLYRSYQLRGGWPDVADMPLLPPGDTHPHVPTLRARLAVEYPSLSVKDVSDTRYDENLVAAVKQFQSSNGLKVDGIVGSETRKSLNLSAEAIVTKIRINLERFRWLPDNLGQRYILVNLGSHQLTAIENGQIKLSMKVIVGQKQRATPSFNSAMTHLVINPYWNVPHKLARRDLLPKQQADPDYFFLNEFNVFLRHSDSVSRVDPYRVDWEAVSPLSSEFPYRLQQRPGNLNALGRLKFMFPNPWNIYLHDTPNKKLFSESQRNFSSGCIRVEDPLALAQFSLNEAKAETWLQSQIDSQENRGRKLDIPLPVYAVYFTAWPYQDEVFFSPDPYERDDAMAKRL
ncbi:L,D-transpeptidase family protein [Methylophaga sp.]|uniref:L,D-transpeptidase family protein n=1 Tax=Methylophaga sp. TaxID=2024840 RepID=UPI003F6A4406